MENSKIEWTDHTFNPWLGCTKVSEGCKHCYAESLMDHRYGKVKWGPLGTRQRTGTANWRKPLQWNKQAKAEGRRYRVFCASLADVFENNPQLLDWRQELFALIEQTPSLDWLLLTKRPENITAMFPTKWRAHKWGKPPENIWFGTSVENQEQADKRIHHLLEVDAKIRFLSCEPLLSPIDLNLFANRHWQENTQRYTLINWIIVGGESGSQARPMQTQWAQDIRRQCAAANVPFFFKQGSAANWPDYKNFATFGDLAIRQFPHQG